MELKEPPSRRGNAPFIQLAVGGVWERALSFPLHSASRASLQTCLSGVRAQGECALEIVYPPRDRPRLLGIRVRDNGFDGLENLVSALFESSVRMNWQSGMRLVRVHFGESAFRPAQIHALEAGVFNAWLSQKTQRVWTTGDKSLAPQELARLLTAKAWWQQTRPAPVLLEAAWATPVEHWAAECISVRQGIGFIPELALLGKALNSLLSPVSGDERRPARPVQ